MTAQGPKATLARQSRHDVERLYGEARLYIGIGSALVAIIFTYFIWQGIPIAEGLAKTNYGYLQAIALWLYYLSWVAGCPFDAYYMKWAFQGSKTVTKVRFESILLVAFLLSAAIAFLWFRHDQGRFSIAFSAFVVINVLGWLWILYTTRPIVRSSRESCLSTKDYFGLLELETVDEHTAGHWQIWRFGVMLVVVASIVAISLDANARTGVATAIHKALSVVPSLSSLSSSTISSLLPDVLIIIFMMFAEGIIWYRRVKMRGAILVLEAAEKKYDIQLMPGS